MYRFDCSQHHASIGSFTLRKLTAADWYAALDRASGPAGSRPKDHEVRNECLSDAIAEVDDQPVPRPFQGWRDWSARSYALLAAGHAALNELSRREEVALGFLYGPTFPLEEFKLDVASVRVDELSTRRELELLSSAASRAGQQATILSAAISEVNGIPRHPTPDEILGWSAKTVEALRLIYQRVNDCPASEVEDFVQAALAPKLEDSARGASGSSSSGSGSPATSTAPPPTRNSST